MPSLQVTMGPVPRCAVGEGGTSGSSQEEEPLPLPSEAPDCTHSSSGGGGKTAQEDAGPGPGGTAGRMLRPVQEDGDLMPTQQSSGLPGQPGTSLQGTEPSASSGVSEEREGLAVRSENGSFSASISVLTTLSSTPHSRFALGGLTRPHFLGFPRGLLLSHTFTGLLSG